MIYIHQVGSINYKETESVDIKAACKLVAPKFVRRTDNFIQLAILGVQQLQQKTSITSNCALYLTSGQGNLSVFQRLCEQKVIEKSPPKPVDFINSLSNTAGFYVSQFLQLDSKNSNLSHISFVVEMALLLAKSDLVLGKEHSILLGGVDQLLADSHFSRLALGVNDSIPLGQGSNWVLLNRLKHNALASVDLSNNEMDLNQLEDYLLKFNKGKQELHLAFSLLVEQTVINHLLHSTSRPRFFYEDAVGFYETLPLYVINQFILTGSGHLLFIDYFAGMYRVIELEVLR